MAPYGTFKQTADNYRKMMEYDSKPNVSFPRLKMAYNDAVEKIASQNSARSDYVYRVTSTKRIPWNYNLAGVSDVMPISVGAIKVSGKLQEVEQRAESKKIVKVALRAAKITLNVLGSFEKAVVLDYMRSPRDVILNNAGLFLLQFVASQANPVIGAITTTVAVLYSAFSLKAAMQTSSDGIKEYIDRDMESNTVLNGVHDLKSRMSKA